VVGRQNEDIADALTYETLPWQPFLTFYIWGAHWCHLANTTEPSMCGLMSNYFDHLLLLGRIARTTYVDAA